MGIIGEILAKLRRILRRSVRLIVIAGDAVCGLFTRRAVVEEEIVVDRDPGGENAVLDTSPRSVRRPLTERVRQAASFREGGMEWRSMLMAHEHRIAEWIAGSSADDLRRVARMDTDTLAGHLAGRLVDGLPPLPDTGPVDVPAPLMPSPDPVAPGKRNARQQAPVDPAIRKIVLALIAKRRRAGIEIDPASVYAEANDAYFRGYYEAA